MSPPTTTAATAREPTEKRVQSRLLTKARWLAPRAYSTHRRCSWRASNGTAVPLTISVITALENPTAPNSPRTTPTAAVNRPSIVHSHTTEVVDPRLSSAMTPGSEL